MLEILSNLILWIGLYWKETNCVLKAALQSLTRTQTTYVILSQTSPGPNGSTSLKAIWWQKSSQHLRPVNSTMPVTDGHPSPLSKMQSLLVKCLFFYFHPIRICVSAPKSTYHSFHYWQILEPFSCYSLGSLFFVSYPWFSTFPPNTPSTCLFPPPNPKLLIASLSIW